MKVRFRLNMAEDKVYNYLLAAYMAEIEYRHRVFVYNEEVQAQLSKMAQWLTSDSAKFGMLLCGDCGNGKSTMLKAFQQLLNHLQIPNPNSLGNYGIQIVDAKYIAHLCKENYSEFLKLARTDMLGIDDLGTEPKEVLSYGNIYTPVIDLLSKRYEEQQFTIVTTNIAPPKFRDYYDSRVADRLNEMMEKIIFRNSSYRAD